jgi:RND family efflux transporter MFP subunit
LFEEGQRVKKGDALVRLNYDLLEKTLQANRALHEQTLTELEMSVINLGRIEKLHAEQLVPERTFDEYQFQVKGLEKKAASLKAEVERLELEILKKTVRAPFDGVVVKRHVDRGEWLSPGTSVATVAKDDVVDIVIEVPEDIIKNVRPGTKVPVKSGGKKITGRIFQIIPSGDVATRVFPIKVRIQNSISLIEGMEARVDLPVGKSKQALIVHRDAVITKFGSSVVFAIIESKAKMIQVKITGFSGLTVGVESGELTEGMNVVIKGNERLMDGQPVNISNINHKTR